jgi:copper chaperone
MTIATYRVEGMTCEHCVRAVREELGRLHGVTGVEVDLVTGDVVVDSAAALPDADVRAAVDEAGYTVAGSRAAS